MKQRAFDPLRLDVAAFAADGGELSGQWAAAELPRLAEAAHAEGAVDAGAPVAWSAQGAMASRTAGAAQPWLHLQADTEVWLQCQRCLQPVREALAVQHDFRFVRSEAEAAAEDADSDEDVLAISRTLNLRELVEDELLLALPLVPRHEVCPQPLPLPASSPAADEVETAPNPFAKLAELKRRQGS